MVAALIGSANTYQLRLNCTSPIRGCHLVLINQPISLASQVNGSLLMPDRVQKRDSALALERIDRFLRFARGRKRVVVRGFALADQLWVGVATDRTKRIGNGAIHGDSPVCWLSSRWLAQREGYSRWSSASS